MVKSKLPYISRKYQKRGLTGYRKKCIIHILDSRDIFLLKLCKNQAMLTLVDKVPTKVGSMQQKEKI